MLTITFISDTSDILYLNPGVQALVFFHVLHIGQTLSRPQMCLGPCGLPGKTMHLMASESLKKKQRSGLGSLSVKISLSLSTETTER